MLAVDEIALEGLLSKDLKKQPKWSPILLYPSVALVIGGVVNVGDTKGKKIVEGIANLHAGSRFMTRTNALYRIQHTRRWARIIRGRLELPLKNKLRLPTVGADAINIFLIRSL